MTLNIPSIARSTVVAMLVALNALGFLSDVGAAESNPKNNPTRIKTVVMVLLPGTQAVHIVEMPSMERCKEAVEFNSKAKCVEVSKVGSDLDRDALRDFVPASGPSDASSEGQPPLTYTPLN